jgi:hypothetical protein
VLTEVSLSLALVTALAGALAGALGGMLGLGGGVFLVPVLVQGLDVPMPQAVAVSLTTVIATSNAISGSAQSRSAINLRLGFMLELFTAAGGLIGSLVAAAVSARSLMITFSVVMASMSLLTFLRRDQRNDLPSTADPEVGRAFFDEPTGQVAYRVRRMPLAVTSFSRDSVHAARPRRRRGQGPILNAGAAFRCAWRRRRRVHDRRDRHVRRLVYLGRGLLLPAWPRRPCSACGSDRATAFDRPAASAA